jgi:hypothetical protein
MRFLVLVTGSFLIAAAAPAPDPTGVEFFETKIRPILATRCFVCHSSQAPKVQGGLQLDTRAALEKGGNSGPAIVAGDPEKSLLIRAIRQKDKDLKMPPGKPLVPEIVADFETWVKMGAPQPVDSQLSTGPKKPKLWSLVPPQDHAPPQVKDQSWVRNAVDAFVLSNLEAKDLHPSPPADRRTLIRRVTYDLTGLPPAPEEIDAFIADKSPDAYARLVDRLLASPHYGERWGRYWLDVARYSDSRNVGERFAYAYTYRDWVFQAFNEDMPYDEFLLKQIAADRLPNRDPRSLAALGFLSLGREFPKSPQETVDDRIDTVMRGTLGLTVSCARCHDHKYDPIPTKDYYSLYGIFNNTRETETPPLLNVSAEKTPRDELFEQRFRKIEKTIEDYEEKRNAELIKFQKTQIADYLMAVRDSKNLTNTGREELVKDRQLNLHMLDRWRKFLGDAELRGEGVFQIWNALASLPNEQFTAKAAPTISAQKNANPLVAAEFATRTPANIREAAERYSALLNKYDKTEKLPNVNEESLRQALHGKNAAVNVPVSEFEMIDTEGDGNNVRGFYARLRAMRALHAFGGTAPRAMAVEDEPVIHPAHVFVRGNVNNPGLETPPHFLSCIAGEDPPTFRNGSGRFDLARAIANKDNPLTARVMVNRLWQHHFGYGIVRTPSDFGLRGDPPTHPELLDYLALRFIESGWSVKKLHRMILLSATYQQSSQDNAEARAKDPENMLLWRMNRQRLDIESLRDSMLAASGQIDLTVGGLPYSLTAQPSVPRRTVYGYIERGRVVGFLSNFDFASPDQHAPLRYNTTVPQQALFLLNSAFITEQASHLTERPTIQSASRPEKRIAELYRIVYGRAPSNDELALGVKFLTAPEEPMPSKESGPWQYGFGEFDPATGKLKSFTPFRYFTGESWQAATILPSAEAGSANLRSTGGMPGEDLQHAVIRRWVSPKEGKISIEGTLSHKTSASDDGDGVRARIVSSSLGELATWMVRGIEAETKISSIAVKAGDTIDFIVDGRSDTENDTFTWAPTIHLGDQKWSAASDFHGPTPKPLTAWQRYAQVLLETNEFAFVD